MLKGSGQLAELACGYVGPQQDLEKGPNMSDIKIKSVHNQFVESQLTSLFSSDLYSRLTVSYYRL